MQVKATSIVLCGAVMFLAVCLTNSTIILEDSATKSHCLLMDFSGEVSVKNDKGGYDHLVVNDGLVFIGNCHRNSTEQFPYESIQLTMVVQNETALTFNFIKNDATNQTYLMRLFYAYYNETEKDINVADNRQVSMSLSHIGATYECNTSTIVKLSNNVYFTLHWIKYQTFIFENLSYSDIVETCQKLSISTESPDIATSVPDTVSSQKAVMATMDPSGIPLYYVIDPLTQHVCILMKFNGSFRIPFMTNSGHMDIAVLDLNSVDADVSGNCSYEEQFISIDWQPKNLPANQTDDWWQLVIHFKRVPDTDQYVFVNMTIVYYLEKYHFIDTKYEGRQEITHYFKPNEFVAPINETFVCLGGSSINFEEKSGFGVDLLHLQMEVFRSTDSFVLDDNGFLCSGDRQLNVIIPIFVGTALAILVLLVIIAYLTSRKVGKYEYEGYVRM